MHNENKKRMLTIVSCLSSDLALSVWSYYEIKNYDAYLKIATPIINSPDLIAQFYAIILQTVLFTIFLMLSYHAIIYFLYFKGNNFSAKYLRFYTFMAALSCFIMILSNAYFGIIPFLLYLYAFFNIGKKK